MAFNTAVIAGVQEYLWADRPLVGAVDGDMAVIREFGTRPYLRIYDASLGEFVPAVVHGRFSDWVQTAQVVGTEVDAAALLANGTSVNAYAGTPTIGYNDSGKLHLTNTGGSDGIAIEANTAPSNGFSAYFRGLIRVIQIGGKEDIYFIASDGSHEASKAAFALHGGNLYPFPMTGTAHAGTQTAVNSGIATLYAAEGLLEIFYIGNNDDRSLPDAAMMFWLNGVFAGFQTKSEMTGGSSNYCNLVQLISSTNEITMRNVSLWVRD